RRSLSDAETQPRLCHLSEGGVGLARIEPPAPSAIGAFLVFKGLGLGLGVESAGVLVPSGVAQPDLVDDTTVALSPPGMDAHVDSPAPRRAQSAGTPPVVVARSPKSRCQIPPVYGSRRRGRPGGRRGCSAS